MFFCLFSSPNNRKHLPTLNQILYIKHFSDKKNKNSKQEALSWMYSSLSSWGDESADSVWDSLTDWVTQLAKYLQTPLKTF